MSIQIYLMLRCLPESINRNFHPFSLEVSPLNAIMISSFNRYNRMETEYGLQYRDIGNL
jgi:hypothetical protein